MCKPGADVLESECCADIDGNEHAPVEKNAFLVFVTFTSLESGYDATVLTERFNHCL